MNKIKINKDYKDKISEFEELQNSLDYKIKKTIEAIKKSEPEIFFEIIAEMNNIFSRHFSEEEKTLRKFKYPEYNAHTLEHRTFLKNTQSYRRRTEDDHKTLSDEIINLLKYWKTYHADGSDKIYIPFIRLQMFFSSNPV